MLGRGWPFGIYSAAYFEGFQSPSVYDTEREA